MIKEVLKYVIVGILLALIVWWVWAGGGMQIARFVRTIPNPIDIIWGTSTSTYQVVLPWQIAIPQGADISGLTENADQQYGDSQDEYSSYQGEPQDPNTLGTPSPYRGMVVLGAGTAAESGNEYIELNGRSSAAVSLQGWSLHSVISGKRAVLPLAANPFILGRVNTVSPAALMAEQSALVYSGISPVGVSFSENRCTGYLAQQQSFEPSLANTCPSSSEAMPTTAENLQRFGSTCIDYVRTLPQCSFPTSLPSNLSPACRTYIANTFTYNGCIYSNRYDSSFQSNVWRLYLGSGVELWSNSHDVIRLLDAEGRTVDSITY